MFRARSLPLLPPRRGATLLIVITLLMLFAVAGLSFVYFADSHATGSRYFLEAQSAAGADVEPELLLAYFLNQLVYDADDDGGVYSALRGHSLARSLYGWNGDDPAGNNVPFNGTGRLRTGPGAFMNPWQLDDFNLVNYTYHPADGFLRDPERLPRTGDEADPLRRRRGPFLGGANVPYTYPDLNNLYLAAVKADGKVLAPSFHRDWAGFGPLDPSNPNWHDRSKPWLKYLVLRPRPADMGPDFPAPADAGGDVKNLVDGPGGNDSIWLDLGFPVLTALDGRKFKPLFAPLVVDLDGRLNVNVHGNARGEGGAHASNQGWGPWEVNLARLAPAGDAACRREWANLLLGSAALPRAGRYGPDRQPGAGGNAPGLPTPPFYAQADYDGADERAGGRPSGKLLLPGQGGSPLSPFPVYNRPPYLVSDPGPGAARGYGHATGVAPGGELAAHPALANPFRPAGDDRLFAVSDMEAPLRYHDTGSPALTSELFRLCPRNFADRRTRRLVTTTSFDVDRPAAPPWQWLDDGLPAQPYLFPAGARYPGGAALGFPVLKLPVPTPPGGDFGADWRGRPAAHGRLDLNRPLPAYPAPSATGLIQDHNGFEVAQAARHQLAEDVFLRLRLATGAGDPRAAAPGSPAHDALRWLAQLAVNIVDYLDPDDYMTPFNWRADEWVLGTELPRLVLNEVYAEFARPPTPDAQVADMKIWVELHNPLHQDASLYQGGAAALVLLDPAGQPLHGIYQVVITRTEEGPDSGLRRRDNVLGDPDLGAARTLDFTDLPPGIPHWVAPGDGQEGGFFVVGPEPLPGGRLRPTYQSATLKYESSDRVERPTLLLRRLACPHLPPNPAAPGGPVDPGLPYNPYVTVDYLERVPVNNETSPPPGRASAGRGQPYAAPLARQQPSPAHATQPQHTFFRHNEPRTEPFDWLVHLDRPFISPMELLHVSGWRPSELTQQFMTGRLPAERFRHRAPWAESEARLYRAFEFLATRPRAAGLEPPALLTLDAVRLLTGKPAEVAVPLRAPPAGATASGAAWMIRPGDVLAVEAGGERHENVRVLAVQGNTVTALFRREHPAGASVTLTTLGDRVPGRVNINTVWDEEILQALADPQPSSHFDEDAVRGVFGQMLRQRTPSPDGRPGPSDRPFRGMAPGFVPAGDRQHPMGLGADDTLLRKDERAAADDPGKRLFLTGGAADHPYLRAELLTKVYNHLTTRSNVFAVWVTVGFFAVTDEHARPVKLGAEIGRAAGRQVRHRMFAIVDRSVLVVNPGPQPRLDLRADSPGTAPTAPWYARRAVPYISVVQ